MSRVILKLLTPVSGLWPSPDRLHGHLQAILLHRRLRSTCFLPTPRQLDQPFPLSCSDCLGNLKSKWLGKSIVSDLYAQVVITQTIRDLDQISKVVLLSMIAVWEVCLRDCKVSME